MKADCNVAVIEMISAQQYGRMTSTEFHVYHPNAASDSCHQVLNALPAPLHCHNSHAPGRILHEGTELLYIARRCVATHLYGREGVMTDSSVAAGNWVVQS